MKRRVKESDEKSKDLHDKGGSSKQKENRKNSGPSGGAIHFIMSLFFIFCGYVNINDPDSVLWIGMYLFGSVLSFATFLNSLRTFPQVPLIIPSIFGVLCVVGMIRLSQNIAFPIENVWEFFETEEGREIGGLFILGFEMVLILLTSNWKANRESGTESVLVKVVYWAGFILVIVAFYSAIYLQPEMNKRLQVPHCQGSL